MLLKISQCYVITEEPEESSLCGMHYGKTTNEDVEKLKTKPGESSCILRIYSDKRFVKGKQHFYKDL